MYISYLLFLYMLICWMIKLIINYFCFRNGNIDVYFGDYLILDYVCVKLDLNCNLYIVLQLFGEDEYGIGFFKDLLFQVRC